MAVSGGPDSLALLLLANAALPGRVEAATVDHGLRPEGAQEAAQVARICAAIGVPHDVLRVEVGAGNLQSRAREARYAALGEWMAQHEIGALATAHHADDQAETLMMRLNRGSGLAGLAGVRATGLVPGTLHVLLRPLLGWRRAELADIAAQSGFAAVHDPSNADERFDRVRMRNALAAADWIDPAALSRSAQLLGEANAALEWLVGEIWAADVVREGLRYRFCPKAPRFVAIEVIGRIISELGGMASRSDIARMHDRLATGGAASLGGVLARSDAPVSPGAPPDAPLDTPMQMPAWYFEPEPPRSLQ